MGDDDYAQASFAARRFVHLGLAFAPEYIKLSSAAYDDCGSCVKCPILHRTGRIKRGQPVSWEHEMAENPRKLLLVYDEECPVCDAYCHMVRVRESVGMLRLVNARDASAVMEEITRQDLDIDQGMVLKVDEVLYYGYDAMHALSLMSSRSGVFNRVNYWVFRSKTRSRILYPVFRSCRNLLLKTLQKTKINNLGLPHNDRF